MTYTDGKAPEIKDLTPHHAQERIVDICMEAIQDAGDAYWGLGRGSGKSTVRGMLAARLLAEDDYPLYEVKAIEQ